VAWCVPSSVGTIPARCSVRRMVHAMDLNLQAGGCCGEIAVRDLHLCNGLESAQNFEYKISHVMDKGACVGLLPKGCVFGLSVSTQPP